LAAGAGAAGAAGFAGSAGFAGAAGAGFGMQSGWLMPEDWMQLPEASLTGAPDESVAFGVTPAKAELAVSAKAAEPAISFPSEKIFIWELPRGM